MLLQIDPLPSDYLSLLDIVAQPDFKHLENHNEISDKFELIRSQIDPLYAQVDCLNSLLAVLESLQLACSR